MPLVLPRKMDQEDIERFIRKLSTSKPQPDMKKVDRQDYSPIVATMTTGEGYINDADIVSKMKKVAATVP